jgi:hypothetical protein
MKDENLAKLIISYAEIDRMNVENRKWVEESFKTMKEIERLKDRVLKLTIEVESLCKSESYWIGLADKRRTALVEVAKLSDSYTVGGPDSLKTALLAAIQRARETLT